jgi:hypothetical protein
MSFWRGGKITVRNEDFSLRKPEIRVVENPPPPTPAGDEAFDTVAYLAWRQGYLRPLQDGPGADPVTRDAPTIILCRSPFRARLGLRRRLR